MLELAFQRSIIKKAIHRAVTNKSETVDDVRSDTEEESSDHDAVRKKQSWLTVAQEAINTTYLLWW